jgi:hypothetical protein
LINGASVRNCCAGTGDWLPRESRWKSLAHAPAADETWC